jgi:predicted nucleotidyltransferase
MPPREVIIKACRDPLNGLSREDFESQVREKLIGRVEAVYFFGSYASESYGPNSDIDLILVVKTDEPFITRAFAFSDLLDIVPRMDILVYTPEEFERLMVDPSPGFWKSVAASLRRFM